MLSARMYLIYFFIQTGRQDTMQYNQPQKHEASPQLHCIKGAYLRIQIIDLEIMNFQNGIFLTQYPATIYRRRN